jgi:DNA-3-methyladenine glycosylase
MMDAQILHQSFFTRPCVQVARELLGCDLCRRLPGGEILRGRIIDVEAYDGTRDRASHAFRGCTPRNRSMFAAGGIAYVYLIYGIHHCVNVVTGSAGHPAAILIRAVEQQVNGLSARGPGRLTRAFQIDRSFDGISFHGDLLWLERGPAIPPRKIKRTPRIGVPNAGAWAHRKLRYIIA